MNIKLLNGEIWTVSLSHHQPRTDLYLATPSLFHLAIITVLNTASVSDLLLAAATNMSGVFIKEEIKDTEETEAVSAFSIADSHSR